MKRPSSRSKPTETCVRIRQGKCHLFELKESSSASFFTNQSFRQLKAYNENCEAIAKAKKQ